MIDSTSKSLYERYLRKVPKQTRSRAVVEAIVFAGVEAVTTSDNPVTMEGIAERAGVGIGSVYDYFKDRHDLLGAVIATLAEHSLRTWQASLENVRERSLEDIANTVVDSMIEGYSADPCGARRIAVVASGNGLLPVFFENALTFGRVLAATLREHSDIEAAELEESAGIVCQAIVAQAGALIWIPGEKASMELRKELVRLFIRRLGNEVGSRTLLVA